MILFGWKGGGWRPARLVHTTIGRKIAKKDLTSVTIESTTTTTTTIGERSLDVQYVYNKERERRRPILPFINSISLYMYDVSTWSCRFFRSFLFLPSLSLCYRCDTNTFTWILTSFVRSHYSGCITLAVNQLFSFFYILVLLRRHWDVDPGPPLTDFWGFFYLSLVACCVDGPHSHVSLSLHPTFLPFLLFLVFDGCLSTGPIHIFVLSKRRWSELFSNRSSTLKTTKKIVFFFFERRINSQNKHRETTWCYWEEWKKYWYFEKKKTRP